MKKALLTVFICLYLSHLCFAWGPKGHALVAEIAFNQLSKSTKEEVFKYLDGETIEDAANWMDAIKGDPKYDNLKLLHYINIDKGKELDTLSTGNVYSEMVRILKDFKRIETLNDEAIKTDLLELMHLVADVHQPLHCGYSIDKGGNDVAVTYLGNESNLHRVWDSELLADNKFTLSRIIKDNNYTPEELATLTKAPIQTWISESRGYLDKCYAFKGGNIGQAYATANIGIVEKRIYLAGVRLAEILESYFGKLTGTPSFVHKQVEVKEININNAGAYVGQIVKVCSTVYETKEMNNGMTYLNLGAAFPNSPLTLVIFPDNKNNFKHNPAKYYADKALCVTGMVVDYKGKIEIVVRKEDEIQIR